MWQGEPQPKARRVDECGSASRSRRRGESMNDERGEIAVKLRVGVFVLVALAAFLGMVYALGARARLFEAHYTIHAEFTEVAGLTEGATVRLAGVQIGRVTDVHLPGEPGGKVRVDLTIARRYADRIRRDSIARIETQGLLGDKVVEVTVGTAAAPPLQPGDVLLAREPTDFARVLTQGADTARDAAALVAALRKTAEDVNRSKLVDDVSATVGKINRVVDQVEHGRGWAHALLYEEPVALKRLNETVTTTQKLLDRVAEGQGPAGVLLSPTGTDAARRFVGAMDRLGRLVDRPGADQGLLPALLFEPKYKETLEDLRTVTRNLRDVSDRIAGGRGALGSLIADGAAAGYLQLVEERAAPSRVARRAPVVQGPPRPLRDITVEQHDRVRTGIGELDRVLGGGVVRGSLVLVGGDPGVGKSTLLLQTARALAQVTPPVLYVSAEESAAQVKMRAERLGIAADGLLLWTETDLAAVQAQLDDVKPRALVVDSIQTVFLPELESAPGSVTQVRECGARLMMLAKGLGIATFLVGHVT